ncbi:hypothetical protein [Stratiformator vulcanicus]|uniref:Uncharacterized protein n=1 Tax=Stratiformator vulcanicus TaxID=2527980 RepID=A0A517QY04_9PLAN|nr:hypothetical protein [Stratiformator vulcanicus]QDT36468.1 hypothetical protein Pan189_08250 [Stratiformator vulcanicus]
MAQHFEHLLIYQHNVQRVFREHTEKYSGIVIPFSIASAFPTGTYGFIRALLSHSQDKTYLFDPRTPLFQKAWDRSNVRPPHIKVAEIFGPPFSTVGLSRALSPRDFTTDLLGSVVQNCLSFQQNFRARDEDVRKLQKYKKLLGVSELDEMRQPQVVVPPYFECEVFGDEWWELNSSAIDFTLASHPPSAVRPVLHLKRLPHEASRDWVKVARSYVESGITSVSIYPNNFKELEASTEELLDYRTSVSCLSSEGILPFAWHGGFFAVALYRDGLSGFANGAGYGEWRDSGYHRGGSAAVRLYSLKLHRFLEASEYQLFATTDPANFGSDTEIMRHELSSGRPLDEIDPQVALDHFVECREREIAFVSTHHRSDISASLLDAADRVKMFGELQEEKYSEPLRRWSSALGQDFE